MVSPARPVSDGAGPAPLRRPGRERKVTIGDVAARANVSKSAVSFVFNGRPGVGEAARERILAAARELDWRPDARARALSRSRAQALGLVIRRAPELLSNDPFFPQFVAGVESGSSDGGYALVLQVVPDRAAEKRAYERFAHESRVDGVFLTDMRLDDERVGELDRLWLPHVVVGPAAASDEPAGTIGLDDAAGVRRAVRHLSALGHRRIAHVAGVPGYVHSEVRRQAWEQELVALGLAPGPVVEGDFTGAAGARATHELLDRSDPPTAIVFANDLMAIAGMSAAADRGVRVPSDLSVVGYDDIPLAPYVQPSLTTVRQDVVEWGRACALALIATVEGREPDRVALPAAEFVVRGSTGPVPADRAPLGRPADDQPTGR
ncbi:LacI family DNA-binding transcriptional regulator [Pseudokineococcus marinus]|uniref:LacI family DNA-binding transcriptional regulator n=1 Tax=Pseudokineococcus marinus TaxID=351215 RepID=A0A849BFI2_9ACTN|nr:LacI family DNA-binding transcriptional regulator [Pseudokineococcus marinus]NNH21830.1 LacI family DNA-binding transcriptional regulator [Pseudokineococcus marinus]